MRILIVTFSGDLPLLKLQLASIKKFLQPCKIDIIINDINCQPVRREIAPIILQMKNHTVNITDGPVNIPSVYGRYFRYQYTSWHVQQLHKIINHIDEPYIVLDTKDIFVKPTSLEDITRLQQPWYIRDYIIEGRIVSHRKFVDFAFESFDLLGKPEVRDNPQYATLRNFTTPFYIDPSMLDPVKKVFDYNLEDFYTWFLSFEYPSEFLLHEVSRQCSGKQIPFSEFQDDDIVTMRHTELKKFKWNRRTWHTKIKSNTKILQIHSNLFLTGTVKDDVWEYFNKLSVDK